MSNTHHVKRGIWALADKSLPMLYGGVFALVVAQTMPISKFGNWSTFQLLWIAATQLGDYFILQPMVKLAAEDRPRMAAVISSSTIIYFLYLVIISAGAWLGAPLIAAIFRAPELMDLMPWMTGMLFSNFIRNIVIRTLQVDYSIQKIFLIDLIFFIVVIGMIIGFAVVGDMHEPIRMVQANVYGAAISSVLAVVLGWKTLSFRPAPWITFVRVFTLGIYNAGTGFMQVIQQQLDGVLLGLFRSQSEVGAYVLAKTFYRGFEAIRDAAGFIVLPAVSELFGKKEHDGIVRLTEAATVVLIALILPIAVIATLGGPFIFHAIYHGTHDASAPLFQIFIVGALALPFTIVASNILLGIGQTRPLYRLTITNTILFAVLFVGLTSLYGAIGAATALSVTSFAYAYTSIRGMNVFVPLTFAGMKNHAREFKSVLKKFIRVDS